MRAYSAFGLAQVRDTQSFERTEAWLIAKQLPFRATRENACQRALLTWSAREMVRALRRRCRHI